MLHVFCNSGRYTCYISDFIDWDLSLYLFLHRCNIWSRIYSPFSCRGSYHSAYYSLWIIFGNACDFLSIFLFYRLLSVSLWFIQFICMFRWFIPCVWFVCVCGSLHKYVSLGPCSRHVQIPIKLSYKYVLFTFWRGTDY